ncbi:MAG TPA: transcriptional regulator FilR1 domain-containing protein [Methanobacterium sp.]|nr:transcriptional regulator FilR1 domain-containing protein [Methanobacterium sp.]
MEIENIFESYDKIKEDLKFISTSDVKTKIILSLKNEPKKLSDIKKDTQIGSSTILHNMRQLEYKNFVIKEFQDYSLTPTGQLIALNLISMINSIYLAKKNKYYLLNHGIDCIPDDLINKIECLNNIEILDHESIIQEFKNSLVESKNINCILGHYTAEILLETSFNKNNHLNVISPENSLNESIKIKNEFKSLKNIELRKFGADLKLELIVLADSMLLNLPPLNEFPDKLFLISRSEKGVKWGNELFNHYLKQSEEFKSD